MRGVFVLATLLVASQAAVFNGVAPKNVSYGWMFLGKFVFDYGDGPIGNVEATVTVDRADESVLIGAMLWLYDDEATLGWPHVQDSINDDKPLECALAKNFSKNCCDNTTVCGTCSPTKENDPEKPIKRITIDGKDKSQFVFPAADYTIEESVRPRYWFVAFGNCKSPNGIPTSFEYKLHFIQIQRSSWNNEFGMNMMGIQTLCLIFFLFYVPFTAMHFYGVFKLKKKLEFMHPMVQLFACIILLQFITITINLIHFGAYVSDGEGFPSMREAGEVTECVVHVLFILMLMLLAKGWAISGQELTQKWFIVGLTSGYLVLQVAVVLWKYAVTEEAQTDIDIGVQIMQILLLLGWLGFGCMFTYTIFQSYKNEDNPVKATLFRNLAIVYVPWIFAVPIATILSFAMAAWQRDRVVFIVDVIFNTVGYMILSFLLWPSRAEEYFCISTPDIMTGGKIDTYEQL